jgi:hypothetical protein
MGVHAAISSGTFPKQGEWLGKRVRVCFNYDTSEQIGGTIVRDDVEDPLRTIIQLDDDRFVLAAECQYQTVD